MTDAEIAALRAAAEKATPGPWRARSTIYEHMIAGIAAKGAIAEIWQSERGMANATYIAAANPAAVLSLLDRLARVEADRDAALRLLDRLGVDKPLPSPEQAAHEAAQRIMAAVREPRA